ncbi:MAG: O-antigen ligase family protein [Phormidesmis sp.]
MDTTGNLSFAPQSDSASDSVPSILQKSQWIGAVGFLALLTFTWLPNSYAYMVGWPYILIWQGAFFILGSYTLWLCRQFSVPFSRLGYGLDAVVGLTILTATLSTLNALFRAVACWNLLLIINYAVCLYFLVNWLRSGKLTRHFLWLLLSATGIITSIISLAMWRPNLDMWLSENFNTAIRNAQPLGHHNFVGGYELLLLPIVISFATTQTGWRKWGMIVASALVIVALYVSGSRGALIGLLALGIVSVLLGLLLSGGQLRRRWALAGCCFVLVMALALFSNPRIRTLFLTSPAAEENQVSVVSLSDGPTKDRFFMMESAQNILKEHPFLGIGPGNLSRVYNIYRPIEAGTGLNLVQQLHNTPAQLAAELGGLGLILYASLLLALLKLGTQLHQQVSQRGDRILLYGIGASWLGYSVSSLSDYQLENIGISTTLVITTALLVSLADAYKPQTRSLNLSNRNRRLSSLCLLALLCANFQMWTRVDVSLYLAYSGIREAQELNFVSADAKWAKAGALVPWDPTYPALASEAVLKLIPESKSEKDLRELRLLAIDYLKNAIKATPNDPWFHQNLAVLLLENDNRDSQYHAKQAAKLSPRSNDNYTYYTLGLTFLQKEETDKAVDALVLEALSNPIFLTANNWQSEPLLSVKDAVIDKTLKTYRQLLSASNKASIQYQWLHEQWVILSWWYGYPVANEDLEDTRALVKAVLVADDSPQKAIALLNEHIKENSYSNDLHLVQARLAPEQYLPELLDKLSGTDEEKAHLEKSVRSSQSMKAWLSEVTAIAPGQIRYGLVFAYRNLSANNIRDILYPGDIQIPVLPTSINLFVNAPREYPQLDYYMRNVRTQQLEID